LVKNYGHIGLFGSIMDAMSTEVAITARGGPAGFAVLAQVRWAVHHPQWATGGARGADTGGNAGGGRSE
jgi:hypothetical protein